MYLIRSKHLIALAGLVTVLMLAGCSGQSNRASEESLPNLTVSPNQLESVLPRTDLVEQHKDTDLSDHSPPQLKINIGEQSFSAHMNSYTWSDNGVTQTACASAEFDLSGLTKEQLAHPGEEISLDWAQAPDTWSINVSFPGQERPPEAPKVYGNVFKLAAGTGLQLYEIQASWTQGSVPYYFAVTTLGRDEDEALRRLAWNTLSKEEQATVIVAWQDAELLPVSGMDLSLMLKGHEVEKKKLLNRSMVQISFPTELDPMVGPIPVVFDVQNQELLGFQTRI